jgi:hypothetical protein
MSPERVFWRPPPPDRSEGFDFFERLECPAPSVSLPFLALNSSSPLARVLGALIQTFVRGATVTVVSAPLRYAASRSLGLNIQGRNVPGPGGAKRPTDVAGTRFLAASSA